MAERGQTVHWIGSQFGVCRSLETVTVVLISSQEIIIGAFQDWKSFHSLADPRFCRSGSHNSFDQIDYPSFQKSL